MKIVLAVFLFFLIAFVGLATGLLLQRRGLRGGCRPAADPGGDCRCRQEATSGLTSEVREVGRGIDEPRRKANQADCPDCVEETESSGT